MINQPHPRGASVAQRALLLEKEEQLRLTLCTVRSAINDLAPVSIFPDDILERLFMYCASWLSETEKPDPKCFAWLHICRRWRTIALNSARLWRHIDISSPLLRYFLQYSNSAPISLISSQAIYNQIPPVLQSCLRRVESIDLTIGSRQAWMFFDDHHPAFTNLRNLRLTYGNSLTDPIFLLFWWPTVTQLTLDRVSIPWALVAGLSTLSLSNLSKDSSPTFSQLYQMLLRSPQLERLMLTNIQCLVDVDESSLEVIDLPYLIHVSLVVNIGNLVTAIMRHIRISHLARVSISCDGPDSVKLADMPFQQALDSAGDFCTVRLSRLSISCLRTDAAPWTKDVNQTALSINRSAPTISVHSSWLLFASSILNFSSIATLELAGFDSRADGWDLKRLLSSMPRLSTIRVAFNDLRTFFTVLSDPSPLWACSSSPLCPILAVLSFNKLGDIWMNFSKHYLASLIELVKRRAEFAPLKVVELMGCLDERDCNVASEAMAKYVDVIAIPAMWMNGW